MDGGTSKNRWAIDPGRCLGDDLNRELMTIPPFDGILNILPPHLGMGGQIQDLSPYRCTMAEVCERFATSAKRLQILKGVLDLRGKLREMTQDKGFQWFDGSFVEDIEVQENRDPGDVDIVTFCVVDHAKFDSELLYRKHTKTTFHTDHFLVPLDIDPRTLVEQTKYWYGLFSHRRDRTWKGMLHVELSETDDDAARKILEKL